MRGFIVEVVVSFRLFKVSARYLEITLPIRKEHKVKQQEIIYFVFPICLSARFFIKQHFKFLGQLVFFIRRLKGVT